MPRHIALIQGHPDPSVRHFGHALADAYRRGAESAGHEIRLISVATLEFPILRTKADWDTGEPPPSIRDSQETIRWANHLVIFYPLWLGSMPAILKAFFEQVFRPGFAIRVDSPGGSWKKLLTGKSARIVVTMGMPAFLYRWYFMAHSLKSLERNILGFSGIGPIRESLVGAIESGDARRRNQWLKTLEEFGCRGR